MTDLVATRPSPDPGSSLYTTNGWLVLSGICMVGFVFISISFNP
ncbi:MAG TPA: hypothetical protein VGM30_18485 [Puia sp.]|jgi:hypothetical protein